MNKILKVMCFILFALFAGINTIYAQGQSPTGLVVDENGQPMIGVQIKIEGTTVGAITDVDGNFTIKAQKGNILLFSYVGYEQQKITYKGEKVLAIKMLPSTDAGGRRCYRLRKTKEEQRSEFHQRHRSQRVVRFFQS